MILKPIDNIEMFSQKAEPIIGVFGSQKWLSIYENNLTLVGIYKDEHQLIGGFYYLNIKKYGFNFIKLPPYTPHCGLFFGLESKNKSAINSFNKEVINTICDYISNQKSALTILAFPFHFKDFQPFIWNKYKVIPNYTYRLDLKVDIETITSHFDSKNRNAINKAVKEEVIVKENKLSNTELYVFFKNTLSSVGANYYDVILKNIFTKFADDTNSFSLSAYKNDNYLGSVFCIYDANTCYYMLAGLNKEYNIQGVTNLLVQQSILKAKTLGCSIFDFEGSMLPGVEKFFRGFGGDMHTYFTVNKAILPLEIALKFKKRELF